MITHGVSRNLNEEEVITLLTQISLTGLVANVVEQVNTNGRINEAVFERGRVGGCGVEEL